MEKKIRLIYPQWQGADIAKWIPNLSEEDSSKGYYLGSMLLNFLAPKSDCEVYTVPVSQEYKRSITAGVYDREIIIKQTKAALNILDISDPVKVVTLGGECSVSVPVFTWLNKRFENETAVIWMDAHPDVTLPEDEYSGYHAMALSACLGKGDKEIMNILPSKILPSHVCIAGLREYEYPYIKERVKDWGLQHFSPQKLADDSTSLIDWIRRTRKRKVMIHFDMDVLDPKDILAAVADGPEGGLKLKDAVRIINEVAKEFELIALTVAEPMPRIAIRLKTMLSKLPLI